MHRWLRLWLKVTVRLRRRGGRRACRSRRLSKEIRRNDMVHCKVKCLRKMEAAEIRYIAGGSKSVLHALDEGKRLRGGEAFIEALADGGEHLFTRTWWSASKR